MIRRRPVSPLAMSDRLAPPAFVISNIEVTDPVGYQKYGDAAVRFANDPAISREAATHDSLG